MSLAETRTTARPAEEATPMIAVDDLVKRYAKRDVNAVDGVSFTVRRGEIFGLLGPNGAGKSTTIGVLTTRILPTSGHARIAGVDIVKDPVAAKRRFAVVPQRNNLDRVLTARQNLLFHAAYFGFPKQERERRADSLLEQFGLSEHGSRKTDGFSGGMAQRLMIARALMHDPELIFLDEPSTGLDPQIRLFIWDRIKELHARGLTVLITTHDMAEADTLCERIAIMDHGKLMADDTPAELRRLVPGGSALELKVGFPGLDDKQADVKFLALLGDLRGLPEVHEVGKVVTVAAAAPEPEPANPYAPPVEVDDTPEEAEQEGLPGIRLYSSNAVELIPPALELASRRGARVENLGLAEATLEDVFITLTGRALR